MHWRGPTSTRRTSRRPLRHLHEMGPLTRLGFSCQLQTSVTLQHRRFRVATNPFLSRQASIRQPRGSCSRFRGRSHANWCADRRTPVRATSRWRSPVSRSRRSVCLFACRSAFTAAGRPTGLPRSSRHSGPGGYGLSRFGAQLPRLALRTNLPPRQLSPITGFPGYVRTRRLDAAPSLPSRQSMKARSTGWG